MPKTTLPTSTTRTTKTCNKKNHQQNTPTGSLPGGGISKTVKTMKAKKIIYIIGAVVCSALAIIFRTAALPIALAYDALDAMANTSNETTDQLLEGIKGKE